MVVDLKVKTYFLVTGASRGIGQTLAVSLSSKLHSESVVVLLARSETGLAKTKSEILKQCDHQLQVQTYSIDFSTATAAQFQDILRQSLSACNQQPSDFERAFIVHNAGTVGDVSKRAIDISDTDAWTQFYHTNVFATISLNSEFYRTFAVTPKLIINVSSKCASVPFVSMSFYCSSRAARAMYFRVLAAEETDGNTLVLNYSPGAVDTDMTELVQRESINAELVAVFKEQRETKQMLTTTQTVNKLQQILTEREFESGAQIDYWD